MSSSRGSSSGSTKKPMRPGRLTVKIRRAVGIKGDEFLGMGKADPYAVVSVGSQSIPGKVQKLTIVDKNAGSNPVWNAEFNFSLEHGGFNENMLHINIYDKDRTSLDDPLGNAKIDLARVLEENNDSVDFKWYTVYYKRKLRTPKPRGKVEVSMSFEEMEGQGFSEAPPEAEGNGDRTMLGMTALGVLVGAGQLVVALVTGVGGSSSGS